MIKIGKRFIKGGKDIEEVDLDVILKIDYTNIPGELTHYPPLIAKVGMWLADAENEIRRSDFNGKQLEIRLRKSIAKQLKSDGFNPTQTSLDRRVKEHDKMIAHDRSAMELRHERDLINSLYWALKAKGDLLAKLDLMSLGIDKAAFIKSESKVRNKFYKSN